MNDEGYTLVEMLAALVIVGLAVSGLLEATRVLGRIQSQAVQSLAKERALANANSAFARLFERRGPFLSDDLGAMAGSPSSLAFDCGGAAACGASVREDASGVSLMTRLGGRPATVRIADARDVGMVFGGADGAADTWPPRYAVREPLRWVALVGGTDEQPSVVASARLMREEVRGCVFDLIAQACRVAAR